MVKMTIEMVARGGNGLLVGASQTSKAGAVVRGLLYDLETIGHLESVEVVKVAWELKSGSSYFEDFTIVFWPGHRNVGEKVELVARLDASKGEMLLFDKDVRPGHQYRVALNLKDDAAETLSSSLVIAMGLAIQAWIDQNTSALNKGKKFAANLPATTARGISIR